MKGLEALLPSHTHYADNNGAVSSARRQSRSAAAAVALPSALPPAAGETPFLSILSPIPSFLTNFNDEGLKRASVHVGVSRRESRSSDPSSGSNGAVDRVIHRVIDRIVLQILRILIYMCVSVRLIYAYPCVSLYM